MSRALPTESALLRGPAGAIEALIDAPETVKGVALVCHPHPLFGGANTNKVAHTLARSFRDLNANAVKYVRRIEELIGAPVALLSTSPERDDTILMRDPFVD